MVVKNGMLVTLADLWSMHRNGAGWGEIIQRELRVKLGTLVRESSGGKSEEFMESRIVTDSGRPVRTLGGPGRATPIQRPRRSSLKVAGRGLSWPGLLYPWPGEVSPD